MEKLKLEKLVKNYELMAKEKPLLTFLLMFMLVILIVDKCTHINLFHILDDIKHKFFLNSFDYIPLLAIIGFFSSIHFALREYNCKKIIEMCER